MNKKLVIPVAAFLVLVAAFAHGYVRAGDDAVSAALGVSSAAFQPGERMPVKYTCGGDNVSPPLSWGPGPAATASYAILAEDPDAPGGTFTHWLIFNIPGNVTGLDENVPAREKLDSGAIQGKNGFGRIGYGGPCPPPGKLHHYHFHVYALDTTLDPGSGASAADLRRAMGGHILAEGDLTGVYGR